MHEAEAQDAGLRIAAKRADGAYGIEITGTSHHPVRREVSGNGSRRTRSVQRHRWHPAGGGVGMIIA